MVVWLDEQHDVGMTFCWIPPGEFRMGSRDVHSAEQPVHRVAFEDGFWLGETPVTQCQYAACFPEHKNEFHGNENHPAEELSWQDSRRYCQWLNQHRLDNSEWLADLPTEAQWEYACRAGTETDYYTGDGEQALARAGWFQNNSGGTTHEVWRPGQSAENYKTPNAFGLYDMHGNVWEWCRDIWSEAAYRYHVEGRIEPVRAGESVDESDERLRVLRGGAWYDIPGYCRSAYRDRFFPGFGYHFQGFRVGLFPGPSCPVK